MTDSQVIGDLYLELRASEMRAVSERHAVTQRAVIYVEAGLPLADVLKALGISRATWYRRVQDLKAWNAGNAGAVGRSASGAAPGHRRRVAAS